MTLLPSFLLHLGLIGSGMHDMRAKIGPIKGDHLEGKGLNENGLNENWRLK